MVYCICWSFSFFVLKIIFNKALSQQSDIDSNLNNATSHKDKSAAVLALIFLGISIVFMSVGFILILICA